MSFKCKIVHVHGVFLNTLYMTQNKLQLIVDYYSKVLLLFSLKHEQPGFSLERLHIFFLFTYLLKGPKKV